VLVTVPPVRPLAVCFRIVFFLFVSGMDDRNNLYHEAVRYVLNYV